MTVNRSRPLQLRLCAKCEKEHPATLFNAKGFCVYCAQAAAQADDAKAIEKKAAKVGDDPLEFRRKAHLDIQARKRSALAKISADKAAKVDQNAELDAVEAAKQELARRELAKNHLLPFIMRFNDKYEPGWVHKDICDKLEWFSAAVAAKQSPRLMIFMPPRHGKSEIGSRSFPAWHLGRYPEHEFIGCSYGSDLANGFSRKVREVVRDPAFTAVFPECAVNKDSQSVEQWLTTKGGGYSAAGVGGPITGKGAHCVSSRLSVTTRRGKIPANQVRVGEEVLGYDHESGQPVWATVEAVSTTRKPELVRSGTLVCTPDHRVWTENRGYIHAGELTPADDLVALRVLRDRVPPQAEGASERNSQAGEPVNPPADVLLATVRPQRITGSGEAHLPRVRWAEGAPREDLQQLLCDAARYGEGQAAMRSVCGDIRPECGGIRESEAAPRRCDPGVLLPGLLRTAPTDPYSGDHTGGTRVPDLQGSGHGAQAAEVLLPRVLSGEPAQHFGEGLQRLSGRVATDASADTASRPPVPPVHAVRGDGGASYRPRLDEPCGDELDRPLSDVPFLVSCDAGACAADLETGLYGPGFDVVDLQTSTENFFAGDVLVHNCLVIDDPVKNRADAESATSREAVWDWYTSTAYTRLAPGGGVLVILTRWHDDDLAGRLLRKQAEGEGDEWVVVEYPAQAVHDELFRKAGEPLHAERYDNEALERIKRAVGPRDWQALYQQNPTPDEGDYFNKGMFQWYGPQDIPDYSELNFYTAWDFAIGEKEQNDYSVGITVGVDKSDRVFVVDIQRGHWGTLDLVDKVMEVYKTWRPAITGLERGHIEMTMRPFLDKRIREERLTSFYIEELKPGTRDKIARARSIQGRMQQGLVFFRKNCNATATLVAEMMRFPNGVHDDQCLVAGTRVSTPGGACDIERVKPGDWVTTPVGPRMVTDAQCTGEAAVYRLETVCGRVIEGSGNHPIYTANRGFVRMDAIKWYDQLLVEFAPCQASKPSKWTVFVSAVTRILRTASIGSIFRRIAVTMHRLSTCTGISGNAPTAPSRRGTTSITSTEIRLIMTSAIWLASRMRTMWRNTTTSVLSAAARLASLYTSTAFAPLLLRGMRRLRGANGTSSMASKVGSSASPVAIPVSAAAKRSSPCATATSNTAPPDAAAAHGSGRTSALAGISPSESPKNASASVAGPSTNPPDVPSAPYVPSNAGTRITYAKSVKLTGRTELVYNITVEGEHVYFANGILTHNCDAMAWIGQMLALLVRPREQKPPPKKSWKDKLNKIARGHSGRKHHLAS